MSVLRGNCYAVLGVEPGATTERIEKAFRYLIELYSDDALATYSLLDPGEAKQVRAQLREAYEVLRDAVRRLEYDVRHGLISGRPPNVGGTSLFAAGGANGDARANEDRAAALARSEPGVLPEPVTGESLRAFREGRGIRLREIADSTKITLRYLEYIEADRFSALPAPVYLRGFLQEYARAVGLDPRRTSEAYLARTGLCDAGD
jgi:flagellar biosynthesis protein FlhG